MATLQITCVTKSEKASKDYRVITNVGGAGWKKSVAQVIASINAGDTFYVMVNGKRADVFAYPERNPKYIRTNPDDTKVDNLLALPDCG